MMFRHIFVLLLIVSITIAAEATPFDEITDLLSRAESLYFEAKFRDAIPLLQRADDLLRPRSDRNSEKISVKLQLALAHVGLNESAQAKTSLRELYAIDAEYRLDPQQFPPKILMLADEAKAEQNEIRCQAVRADARKYLDAGNAGALFNLMQSMKAKCTGLDAMEPDLAQLLYKLGVDAYKAGQYPDALEKFRSTLKLAPKHELAAQYVELTQNKLQVNADRQRADQMRTEYRNALTALVEAWNRACASGDAMAMETLRKQLPEHLQDPSWGEDILAGMNTCTKKGCMTVSTQLALARLKIQVNPVVPPAFQDIARRSQVTVQVKARIDEKGDVTVMDAQGGSPVINEAVRGAVEHWKFAPIMDPSGPRCADALIPVVIKP